jgi:hypothetical protein
MRHTYFFLLAVLALWADARSQGWEWRSQTAGTKIVKDLNNDLYVLANISSGFTITKFNTGGQVEWTKGVFGPALVKAYKVNADNELVIAGNCTGEIVLDSAVAQPRGERSFFLLKLSAAGNLLELAVYGSASDTYVNDLFINGRGEYLLAGGFRGSFDMNGREISGDHLNRFFLIKTDARQQVLWSEVNSFASATGEAWMDEIVETSSGTIYATFSCYGLLSFKGYAFQSSGQFLVRLDTNRQIMWNQYLCYPAESFRTYSDMQLAGDTVFMNMYFTHHYSNAYIFRWSPDGTERYIILDQHSMAYAVHNNIIYYASAGHDQPINPQNFYRKVGRLTSGLEKLSQADSVLTDFTGFCSMEVIDPANLYISANGDGLSHNFIGRYALANTMLPPGAEASLASRVYPNPSNGIFYLSQETDQAEVKVFTARGQAVRFGAGHRTIDLSGNAPGLYFVRMESQGRIAWEKLMLH